MGKHHCLRKKVFCVKKVTTLGYSYRVPDLTAVHSGQIWTLLKSFSLPKVVEKWIGTVCPVWLADLVTAYKTAVLPFLQMLRMDHMSGDYLHALSVFLVFLTFLGRINAEHGYPVSYEAFYIPNLHHICDLKLAYLNWRIAKQQAS
jgi:hypothetical protein